MTPVSSMLAGMATLTTAEKLQRINEYDAKPPSGPLSFVGQHFGPQPWFIAFFKHFGQRVDPIMSRISGGEWIRSVYGLPGLILHTTGAKSGAPRANPVPHPYYMQRLPGKRSPANPELMVAHRFTADTPKMTDATFLAANPEIMAYQRYVAATAGQQ